MIESDGEVRRYVVPGRPITKKNSQQIIVNPATRRPMVIPSKQYKEYAEVACPLLQKQHGCPPIIDPVKIRALYWLPSRRSWPDLVGLMQATADILEEAGVIANDRNIVSWDGSMIAGVSNRPRVEIEMERVADCQLKFLME